VVTVSGKGSGRLTVAGLACYRPGARITSPAGELAGPLLIDGYAHPGTVR
jgi:hypothetical protein